MIIKSLKSVQRFLFLKVMEQTNLFLYFLLSTAKNGGQNTVSDRRGKKTTVCGEDMDWLRTTAPDDHRSCFLFDSMSFKPGEVCHLEIQVKQIKKESI